MKKIKLLLALCIVTSFYNTNSMMISPSSIVMPLSRVVANGSRFLLKKHRLFGRKVGSREWFDTVMFYNYTEEINKANQDGRTPLYEACLDDNLDIVTLLLNNGAKESINKAINASLPPLKLACSPGHLVHIALSLGHLAMVKLFHDAKESYKCGFTILYWACRNNNLAIVELLLANGAQESINIAYNNDKTPLFWACHYYNLDMIELLLKSGADINKAPDNGWTPLRLACKENNLDLVKLLLANGAKESVNIVTKKGWTPLYEACRNNNLDIVKLLLVHGANIDQKSLNEAANKPEIYELLTFVQQYDNLTDKIEFIIEQQDDIKCSILIKRAIVQSLNEIQKNGRSIDGTVFGKLYGQLKDDEEFKIILDVPVNCNNIYEFIKSTAGNNHIYLKKDFIDKNIVALKSKAALRERKFTDTTIEFAEQE